jgi:hypothetical protein
VYEIHDDSVEPLDMLVRSEHPTNGEIDLSGQTVHLALPAEGASPATWVAATWLTGTERRGKKNYYVASASSSGFTLAAGTTYRMWARVGGVGGAIIRGDAVRIISS